MPNWISVHLFYTNDRDTFIKNDIGKIVLDLKKRQLITSFFFVRYFERGPHIRLRLLVTNSDNTKNIQAEVLHFFEKIFISCPSEREENQNWMPNNSVQFIPYAPETKRYGGKLALQISEQQFEASSIAVIRALQQTTNPDYSFKLVTALRLHISFAFTCKMHAGNAAAFFKKLCNKSLRQVFVHNKHTGFSEVQFREKLLTAFQHSYQQQATTLKTIFTMVWEKLNVGNQFDENWLNQWIEKSAAIYDQLTILNNNQKITFPDDTSSRLDFLYDSYIHMTNNRLGINNADEPFIAYILHKLFSDIKIRNT